MTITASPQNPLSLRERVRVRETGQARADSSALPLILAFSPQGEKGWLWKKGANSSLHDFH